MQHGHSHGKAVLWALGLLFLAVNSLSAQRGWGRTEYYDSNLQVAGSRTAQELLTKAEKDLESKEYDRCVRLVQKVLDTHASGALSSENGRFVGIREYCNDFLRKLPEEGRETYRRIFDSYARDIYERGLAERDSEALGNVLRRYQETSFGERALLAAMDLELSAGNFSVAYNFASLHLDLFPESSDHARRAAAAGALAARMLGDRRRLRDFEKRFDKKTLMSKIAVAGDEVTLAEFFSRQRSEFVSEGPMMKAPDASRFLRARWRASFDSNTWGTGSPSRLDDFKSTGRPRDFAWSPILPALDEGALYLSDGVQVKAFSLFDPEEKWTYKGAVTRSQARVNLSSAFPVTLDRNLVFASLEIPVERETRIWNYTPQMAVPERRLHAIDASRGTPVWTQMRYRHDEASEDEKFFVRQLSITSQPLVIGDSLYVSATRFHTSYHHYVCCFDRNDGRLRWSVFVCTGQMEQNMFGNRVRECVSGNLVEKDGILYYSTNIGVIAAVDARLRTLKFTAEYEQNGIPRQERSNRQVHERAPTWANNTPVIIDDTIFFTPMDSQDLVALDTRTERTRVILKRTRNKHYRYIAGPYQGRLAVLGSQVAFYDTKEQRLLEASGVNFSELTSRSSIRDAGVIGRPAIVGNRMIAPVNHSDSSKLFVWDLDSLKIIHEIATDPKGRRGGNAGNLSYRNGVFVMASTGRDRRTQQLLCYFDREELMKRLAAAMKADPTDPRPHFQAAEIALQEKVPDIRTAVDEFEEARRLAKSAGSRFEGWADKARDELYRLYVNLAKDTGTLRGALGLTDSQCYERALEVAREDGQKVDILFRLMKRSIDGRSKEKFEKHYRTLVSRYASSPYDHREELQTEIPELATFARIDHAGMVATLLAARFREQVGPPIGAVDAYQSLIRDHPKQILARRSAWAIAHEGIADLIKRHGRKIYAKQAKEAKKLFDASESGAITPLRRLLDLYPNSELVGATYIRLAERLIAAGHAEEAVGAIEEFLWKFRKPTGEVLAALARAYDGLGLKISSRQVWQYAQQTAPRDLVQVGEETFAIDELAAKEIARLAETSKKKTPALGMTVTEAWKKGRNGDADVWSLILPRGDRPDSFAGHFLAFKSGQLQAFSLESEEPIWNIAVRNDPRDDMMWFDGQLIGVLDSSLACIDAKSGKERWRVKAVDGRFGEIVAAHGKVFGIVSPLTYNARYSLQARSLVDGDLIFERSFSGSSGSGLVAGSRWLILNDDHEDRCHVLDGHTGQPSPAWPEGFRHAGLMRPDLNSDERIVAVIESTSSDRRRVRRVVGYDGLSGEPRWDRALGEGSARILLHENDRLVYRLSNKSDKTSRLIGLDTLTAKNLFQSRFESDIRVGPDCRIDGDGVFVKATQIFLRPRRTQRDYIEQIALETGESRWKTASFGQGARPTAYPFQEGVLVLVTERVFRSGRNRSHIKATLNFVDRKTGRVESSLEFDHEPKRSLQDLVFILDGGLVVADGPLLKVLKP